MAKKKITKQVPLLPLRGLLVFPTMVLHIDVGRERSVAALEKAMLDDNIIFLATQKDMSVEEPKRADLHKIGTLAYVKQMLKLPNGTIRVLVEGLERGQLKNYEEQDDFTLVEVTPFADEIERDAEQDALMRLLLEHFENYAKSSKKVSTETYNTVADIEEPGRLADMVASHLSMKVATKQEVLETFDISKRLELLITRLHSEQEVVELEKRINQRVKKAMEQTQKEFYLREQMKAIQSELGDKDGKSAEVVDLKKRIEEAKMPESTEKIALKELDRYEKLPSAAAESGIIRNYIEWLVTIPWSEATEDRLDINYAEDVLNRDHDGLESVKERVLEYLAVQQMTNSLRGPILCLVGPPGVGKTSLAKSIAESLDRNFVRVSLGGVRDESEIRGHRRTYVGAMPGRIIQGMKKAGTVNPVFLLDEIDKMSNDFRGDPSSAMLEVLDPEQNNSFSDHYIEEPFDLSNVLFIATANDVSNIPGPLLDRMELIQIGGYTEQEKTEIAIRHLLSKQIKEHGLKKSQLTVKPDALQEVVRRYTREAGVRSLERVIGALCRKAAKQIAMGEKKRVTVTKRNLPDFLGKPIYRYGQSELEDTIGAVTGLAYTAFGGDTLTIEVSLAPGKGKLQLTGKLGDVMQESAQTAHSFVRANAAEFKIDPDFYETQDIHIHVPEGAVPKDGPSAGITIATALISALTKRPVRRDVGMTGEITLRGRVLPIGGLKEKSLAAHRAGLTTILMPQDNTRDIDDIPETVRDGIRFIPVATMDQVLEHALKGE